MTVDRRAAAFTTSRPGLTAVARRLACTLVTTPCTRPLAHMPRLACVALGLQLQVAR